MNSEVLRKILVAGAAVAALSVAANEKSRADERDDDGEPNGAGARARDRLDRYRAAQCSTPKRIDPG